MRQTLNSSMGWEDLLLLSIATGATTLSLSLSSLSLSLSLCLLLIKDWTIDRPILTCSHSAKLQKQDDHFCFLLLLPYKIQTHRHLSLPPGFFPPFFTNTSTNTSCFFPFVLMLGVFSQLSLPFLWILSSLLCFELH